MKKGFTMIELVFVIVILGILASIAVPRLAATKDDAGAVKAAAEIKDVITQLAAKYTIDGKWTATDIDGKNLCSYTKNDVSTKLDDFPTMKTVVNRDNDKWNECIELTPSGTKGNIEIIAAKDKDSSYCKAVRGTPAVKEWIALGTGEKKGIMVGGSGIFK